MMSRLTWRPVESNYSGDLFIQSSHNLEMPYLRCFQKHTPLSKSAKKKTIAFSIVFHLTPHFRLFSAFQRISRWNTDAIVFWLAVFLEFTTFYRHENAPQLYIKIGVLIFQRTLILIQFEVRFLLHLPFYFDNCLFLLAVSIKLLTFPISTKINSNMANFIHDKSLNTLSYPQSSF